MNNSSFGKLLARIRRKSGHISAHAFFKAAGGARGLGFTYFHYLRIEQGKQIPKPDKLKPLTEALGLYRNAARQDELRSLLTSYVDSLLTDRHLADAFKASQKPRAQAPSPRPRAVDLLLKTARQVTEREIAFLVESPDRYRAFLYCVMTEKPCSLDEIAKFWQAAPAGLSRELAALAKRGFIVKTGKNSWATSAPYYRWPARSAHNARYYKVTDEIEAEAERHAEHVLHDKNWFLLSKDALMSEYLPLLNSTLDQCHLYEASSPEDSDGAYMLRVSVKRLVDF